MLFVNGAPSLLALPQASAIAIPQTIPCGTQIASTYSTLDKSAAINHATSSQDYSEVVAEYNGALYNSIFQIDKTTASYPTCTEEVLSYNIVFTLLNSTDGWAGYLVITENQNLTVIGSSLQTEPGHATNYSFNWAGYEAYANSGASQAIYEAVSDFTQPTATDPSTGCGSGGTCNIATWVGLENQQGGSSNGGLAQDGTTVDCTVSGSSCSNTYFAWYEILPANWIQCTSSTGGSVTVAGSDKISAETENEAAYGGSSSKYDFDIYDTTIVTSCYTAGLSDTQMTAPTWSAFIVENAEQVANGYYDPLSGFGTTSFSGAGIYTGGSFSTINNFYTYSEDMHNQGTFLGFCSGSFTTNVVYGTLSSTGAFTMTYQSSQYTPVYSTGC